MDQFEPPPQPECAEPSDWLRLPAECRDFFERAPEGKVGRQATEHWRTSIGAPGFDAESKILEKLIAGLVCAYGPTDNKHTLEKRYCDALSAILGRSVKKKEERADYMLLLQIAEDAAYCELPDDELREIARMAIGERSLYAAKETVVRRLVIAYKSSRLKLEQAARTSDSEETKAQTEALRFLRQKLCALGIRFDIARVQTEFVDLSM